MCLGQASRHRCLLFLVKSGLFMTNNILETLFYLLVLSLTSYLYNRQLFFGGVGGGSTIAAVLRVVAGPYCVRFG